MKRYVIESGTDAIRAAMEAADQWFMCRVGYVEMLRAIHVAGVTEMIAAARADWGVFAVVEIDQALVQRAAGLAVGHGLRSLDALHLAAALTLRPDDLVLASWDDRLSAAAEAEGIVLLPRY